MIKIILSSNGITYYGKNERKRGIDVVEESKRDKFTIR